jgi:hypothetical protein
MALNPKLSNAAANAAADAVGNALNSGFLRIYDGTQPANADTAVGAQVLLAELTLNADAFAAAAAGVATANAITADASANATGTATWFRVVASNGTSVYFDGSVGTSAADLIVNSTAFQAGANVSCSAFTFTINKG